MMIETWYLLFNDKKELMGAPIQAEARHIYGLKEATKEQYSNRLRNVEAHCLVIWRCKQLTLLATDSKKSLQNSLSEINFLDREQVVKLPNAVDLADLELGTMEILLVQVPGLSSFLSLLRHQFLILGMP